MGSADESSLEAIALRLLEPEAVTREKLAYYVRRAKRLGIYWSILDTLERALIQAALQTKITEYRGKTIKSLLARLIAKIELHTMKGRVLMLGLQRALSKLSSLSLTGFSRLLKWAREKLNYILYLGRNMIVAELYFAPMRDIL